MSTLQSSPATHHPPVLQWSELRLIATMARRTKEIQNCSLNKYSSDLFRAAHACYHWLAQSLLMLTVLDYSYHHLLPNVLSKRSWKTVN